MPGELLEKFRMPVLLLLVGILFVSLGILFYKSGDYFSPTKVEIIDSVAETDKNGAVITVEIAGEVIKPGVYKLDADSRVEDLIIVSDGLSANADRGWIDKYLNRASKLSDGQKVYIPNINEQSSPQSAKKNEVDQSISGQTLGLNSQFININTSSAGELDKLPGIGLTYAQKIIEQRPYSNIDELLTKKVLPKSTYEKIKNQITIY